MDGTRILVAGATGQQGGAVIDALASKGHSLRFDRGAKTWPLCTTGSTGSATAPTYRVLRISIPR